MQLKSETIAMVPALAPKVTERKILQKALELPNDAPLASKLESTQSPSIKVSSSPEAILSTISILMEDGGSVPADTLLKVAPQVWKLNHGLYPKKLSKFISTLIEFKDVALASKKSGLSLDEIRY